jgi:hypothetical protein
VSFSDVIQDNIKHGLIWVVAAAVTTAGGAIIATSRDDAVQQQQIATIRARQNSERATLQVLASEVGQLNVNIAVLTQEMRDHGLATQPYRRHK